MTEGRDERSRLAGDLISSYAILEEGPSSVAGSWMYIPVSNDFRWSEGMYKLFGLDINTKVQPDVYIEFSVDEYKDTARRIANAIYEGFTFDEHLQIKADGSIKTIRVIGAPRDIMGEHAVLGVDFDVTDRDNESAVATPRGSNAPYDQLRKSDKAKTTFFNSLSHEFHTPTTLVIESLNKIIRKFGADIPDSIAKELEHAQRNAARIQKLVKTLNDFTHLEHRKENARYIPTDICKLTNQVASAFRTVIEKAGLYLIVRSERVQEPLYIDHDIFETVLSNLLSNAFKFTFQGGITITISNTRKHVKISVADTGHGIDPANQKKIFQRFSKFDTSSARSLDGMGIGLPLVKDLVELHGGNVSVISQPKKGSEFVVSLPKGTEHVPPEQMELSKPSAPTSMSGAISEIESWPGRDVTPEPNSNDQRMVPTVVVAEPDREMRSYIVRSLQSKYKVLEADNGQQVLDLVNSGFLPDLIVTDVAMPRMDGFQLLSSIRNMIPNSGLPVILLTEKSTADEEVKGLYYGADDYLVKPFSSRELIARVETRIEISHALKNPVQFLTKANSVLEERVHHYMTQLENYNRELNEKNAKLTAVNEELTGLTFAASHDLREPMRKIRLFIGRLIKEEKDNLGGNSEHYFQRILSFVHTMNDLVNDITLYANFNDTIGSTSNIDLKIMLTALVDFLTPVLKEKGASIRFEVDEGLTGNYDQVRQALYNLLSNALKFGRNETPLQILITGQVVPGSSISHDRADTNASYYRVDITDNGIGIDPAYHKQIFELFRKLHKKSAYPGTGIGLAIVRRIMENHNGFVTVDSTPDKGSKFSCFFPARAGHRNIS